MNTVVPFSVLRRVRFWVDDVLIRVGCLFCSLWYIGQMLFYKDGDEDIGLAKWQLRLIVWKRSGHHSRLANSKRKGMRLNRKECDEI